MAVYKLIAKLLKLKDFRYRGLAFRRGNRLEVLVKPYKNGCRCAECGRRGRIVRQRSEVRYWRDIPVGPWSIWLMYWPHEIHCETHGRVTEQAQRSDGTGHCSTPDRLWASAVAGFSGAAVEPGASRGRDA
jgi:hypothetical protein